MSDFEELLARVNAATGPDRELDAAIDIALFGGETVWRQANYIMDSHPASKRPSKNHHGGFAFEAVPLYTSYLDASLGSVLQALPGWAWKLVHEEGRFIFVLRNAAKLEVVAASWVNSGSDPALAILASLLAAKIAEPSP